MNVSPRGRLRVVTLEDRRHAGPRADDATESIHAQSTTPSNAATRSETDSFGPIDVAADRYWGAQTERSRQNFKIGHDRMPIAIIHALAIVKLAAAETNRELGQLDARRADASSVLPGK